MLSDDETGRERYEGIGFHDLRRANATGLVAAGGDVTIAQALLGHSESRLTLDVYAQAVAELGQAAAAVLGSRRRALDARWSRGQSTTRVVQRVSGMAADQRVACEPERRIELLTYALRVRCSAV